MTRRRVIVVVIFHDETRDSCFTGGTILSWTDWTSNYTNVWEIQDIDSEVQLN